MSRYDVLVVGGAGVDTIVRVDRLEIPAADSLFVPPVRDYVAHTGNGVALGLHALGRSVKFLDFLGDDPQAALVLAEYARRGLDFSHVVSATGTPRAVNLVDAAGRRFSFYDGRHPADLRLPRDFWLPFLEQAGHVHLSITGVNRDLYPDVHRLGVTSSTDLHDWDGTNPHHRHYALESDLVFLSTAGVRGRHEQVMRAILEDGRAQVVVAMSGAEGSFLLGRGDAEVRHFPVVVPERPVVDTNGAGDAFVTGFLDFWLAGRPVEECMLAGAVSGAEACTTAGTHTDFVGADALASGVARASAASPR
ncbi:carbohydrate kinase family protein [Streptacidiphilus sp. ASG 303]|uniref:carbohydrate kinase family protein n=1 Tax=Streptacidiphilus sp. ASG 303 TaxID=2896847 RepID=UPI001E3FDECA|nr:carbohydrate kinase family protein [Streptacidiphilus sp. ASG 303]MCD0482928.1 carbohydrate kinase family protein [Streptacidiphilus sp. ASG 303]